MRTLVYFLVVVLIVIVTLPGSCGRAASDEPVVQTASTASPTPNLDDPEQLERFLDALIAERMAMYKIPSEAVAVVKDGQVLFAKGYGHADPEKRIPVDPERTLFRIGSVSKLFVWTAVMQLVEQRKLDLDADVNTYLAGPAGHAAIRIPDTYPEPVTLAHLLTHTAGFDKQDTYGISPNREGWMPLENYLAEYMSERVYPPGQFHVYSNYGTSLAAYLVERVSGMPFEEYVERFIFHPLGMARSTFRQPLPPALSDDLATGVVWWFMKGRGAPGEFEWMQPAGSMSTTAADMASFMIAHLQDGRLGEGESSCRILEEQTAADMHSQHFTYDPRLPGVTYGFFEDVAGGTRVIYHAGGSAAFSAHMALIPDYDVGLFEVYSGGQAGSGFVYPRFMEYFFPAPAMPGPSPLSGASSAPFVGEYVDVAVNHSTPEKLLALIKAARVESTGEDRLTFQGEVWVPVAPLTFRQVNGGDLIIFRTAGGTADGRVTYLIRDQLAYEKLPWHRQTAFHAGVLLACLLIFVSTAVICPLVAQIPHRHTGRPGRTAQLARWTAWIMSVVFLSFLAGFGLEVWSHGILYYGMTPAASVLLVLPLLGAALAGATLILAVAAWTGWKAPARHPYWSLWGRMHYTLVALAGIAFVAFAGSWNLLGL